MTKSGTVRLFFLLILYQEAEELGEILEDPSQNTCFNLLGAIAVDSIYFNIPLVITVCL